LQLSSANRKTANYADLLDCNLRTNLFCNLRIRDLRNQFFCRLKLPQSLFFVVQDIVQYCNLYLRKNSAEHPCGQIFWFAKKGEKEATLLKIEFLFSLS
jgi:hypothetical protein